jgi:hypothetical protein
VSELKERDKIPFAVDVILENSKNSTKKNLLYLMNEFSKDARHKMDVQNSVVPMHRK